MESLVLGKLQAANGPIEICIVTADGAQVA